MTFIWILAILFLGFVAYVRFAPSHPEVWHVDPRVEGDKDFANGVTRLLTVGKDGLRRIHSVAGADPRTDVLAGSVEEGKVTYVTRTRVMGFPDYTTVMQSGEDLLIYARSRFGRKDLGVNRERVERWIEALATH